MLVIHTYVKGKSGHIERAYDLIQDDGSTEITGKDIYVDYTDDRPEYFTEKDAINFVKEITEDGQGIDFREPSEAASDSISEALRQCDA